MRRELVTEIIHVAQRRGSGLGRTRACCTKPSARLMRDGRAAGDVLARAPRETLTELVLGAFYALMFNWAHLESYPLRRHALAAARFLGDALCGAARRGDDDEQRRATSTPSSPIPNGWFAVAWSRTRRRRGEAHPLLRPGARALPHALAGGRTCSTPTARTSARTSAEGGRVVGESLRCPFHGWQYDGTRRASRSPTAGRIPPRARVAPGRCVERNRMIFVWHHAEGKPPELGGARYARDRHPDWTEPRSFELEVPVHMQDMAENNCDPVHFQFVHGNSQVPHAEVSYGEGGRIMRMASHRQTRDAVGMFDTTLERDSWGLGLAAVRIERHPGRGAPDVLVHLADRHAHTHSRWLFTVTRTSPTSPARSSSTASRRRAAGHAHLAEQDPPREPGALRGRHVPRRVPPLGAPVLLRPGLREDAMDRYLVISSDCHAGLPPERYREYLDPQYRADLRPRAADPARGDAQGGEEVPGRRHQRGVAQGARRGALGRLGSRRARARARRRRHRRRGDLSRRHHRDEHAALRRGPLAADRERSCRSCNGRARAPTTAGSPSSARWRPSAARASRSCRSAGTSTKR